MHCIDQLSLGHNQLCKLVDNELIRLSVATTTKLRNIFLDISHFMFAIWLHQTATKVACMLQEISRLESPVYQYCR